MSELLNIWREFGSYNRYGETKNSIFFGLLIALGGVSTLETTAFLGLDIILGGNKFIYECSLILSGMVCLSSFFPILKLNSVLLDQHFQKKLNPNPYYFYDVAGFPSADEWLLHLHLEILAADSLRASYLANQIWIIARIARRKFILMQIAVMVLCAGWILSWSFDLIVPIISKMSH